MKRILLIFTIFGILLACASGSKKTESQAINTDTTMLSTLVLKVGGMHCTGCEQTICKAVEGLNGVNKVNASYLDSVAIVVYDAAQVNSEKISAKINEVGYKVLAEK
jgi:copper chaperone CopZ